MFNLIAVHSSLTLNAAEIKDLQLNNGLYVIDVMRVRATYYYYSVCRFVT